MKQTGIRKALGVIGDIFNPLLPGIISAGLCGAAASLIARAFAESQTTGVMS